ALMPGTPLLTLLEQEQINLISLTPSALALLPVAQLPQLRVIICGGEACSHTLVERWAAGRTFVNSYGPTESTVDATMTICQPDSASAAPSIGRPLPNL